MNLLNCQSSFCVTLEVKGSSNISILSLKPEADVSHGSDSKSSATQVMELHSTRALAAAQISELTAPTRVDFMKKGSKQKTLVKILDEKNWLKFS